MTAAKVRASDRLAVLKAALPKLEQEFSAVMAERRECVLSGDVAGRRRCDYRLRELRDDMQAARDGIDWLPPLVMRERAEADNPSTAAACEKKVSEMERRLAQLRAAQRAGPVSAGVDAEADKLVVRIGALRERADFLRKFEAANQSESAA